MNKPQKTRHYPHRSYRHLVDWLRSLELAGHADRTIDDYERTVVKLFDYEDAKIDAYTVDEIERFILDSFGANNGARTRLASLRSFFGWAHKRGRTSTNPAALIDLPPRKTKKLIEVFSDEELARIYAVDPLAVLICETGMRKSEARRLQRVHVNLDTRELRVYEGKGGKDRTVPLTARAERVVRDMDAMGLQPAHFFWWSRPGGGSVIKRDQAISDTAMHRWWAAPADDPVPGVLAREQVPYRNLHVTRHTYATRLMRRGARIETVKEILGHSSIQTTVDVYGHMSPQDARAAVELLDE